jgi:hypothetical protein
MFDWDEHNLRKIRAHRIKREEVEQALSNDPILIYEQRLEEEVLCLLRRLLALVVTERKGRIRVVTAYDLDAGQKRDYLTQRLRGY